MSRYPSPSGQFGTPQRAQPIEYGVQQASVATFMNAVYAWMCVGLATTAVVAWYVASNPKLMRSIFAGGTFMVLILAELGLVFAISYAINRISAGVAMALFILYSALNGLTLSAVLIVYSLPTIGIAFAVTAGMFGAMSIIGYVTKRDLTNFGSFLMMALIGMIIASVINIFLASSGLMWVITYAGVAIFLGLTMYDTQRLKELAYATQGNQALASRLAVVGSLTLYLDFINLFLLLLRLLGRNRD